MFDAFLRASVLLLEFVDSLLTGASLGVFLGDSLFVIFFMSLSLVLLLEEVKALCCSWAFLLEDSSARDPSFRGDQRGELLLLLLAAPPAFFCSLSSRYTSSGGLSGESLMTCISLGSCFFFCPLSPGCTSSGGLSRVSLMTGFSW